MKLATPKGSELASSGTYLKTPGKYHLLIEDMRVGLSTKDKTIDGTTVKLKVLAGEHKGKTVDLVLWNVKLDGSEKSQAMTIKRLTNFYIAANVLQPEQLGEEVEFNEEDASGATIVAELGPARKQDDNGNWVEDDNNVDWHYSEIYHVDDPKVADVPKCPDALELIDAAKRHTADWFAYRDGGTAAASKAGGDGELFDDI